MTVERGQAAPQLDPQASLRTELVGQLAVAQLALEAAIAELSRSGGDAATIAASRIQLTSLISLRQQIGTATGSLLAELRAEVTAAASSATALAQQANGSASNSNAGDATTRAAAARQTIENVGREIFDKNVLDPYLQFASEEDEAAYRKREEQRRRAYERELEKHTVEGDRRAGEIVQSQLADAKTHGAAASPDFANLSSRADAALEDLKTTQQAAPAAEQDKTKMVKANAPSARAGGDDDISGIAEALKVTGISIENAPDEPTHGVPARGRIAAVVQPATRG